MQNSYTSKKKPCPICGKMFHARGVYAHAILAHKVAIRKINKTEIGKAAVQVLDKGQIKENDSFALAKPTYYYYYSGVQPRGREVKNNDNRPKKEGPGYQDWIKYWLSDIDNAQRVWDDFQRDLDDTGGLAWLVGGARIKSLWLVIDVDNCYNEAYRVKQRQIKSR